MLSEPACRRAPLAYSERFACSDVSLWKTTTATPGRRGRRTARRKCGSGRSATDSAMLGGEIWHVDLDPARGNEANTRRPAVVVSNARANATATRLGRGAVTVV